MNAIFSVLFVMVYFLVHYLAHWMMAFFLDKTKMEKWFFKRVRQDTYRTHKDFSGLQITFCCRFGPLRRYYVLQACGIFRWIYVFLYIVATILSSYIPTWISLLLFRQCHGKSVNSHSQHWKGLYASTHIVHTIKITPIHWIIQRISTYYALKIAFICIFLFRLVEYFVCYRWLYGLEIQIICLSRKC